MLVDLCQARLPNGFEGNVGEELSRVFEASAAHVAMAKKVTSAAESGVDDKAPGRRNPAWASQFCVLLERTFLVKLRDVSIGG